MMSSNSSALGWVIDSSTFINGGAIDRVSLILSLRAPALMPEFIYRVELGVNAKPATRQAAEETVNKNRVMLAALTFADLEVIAGLKAPRRIGLGELACAVIARREQLGVLCDDLKAKRWCDIHMNVTPWHTIEDVLVDAAMQGYIGEGDLIDFERVLGEKRYYCRFNLQVEFLHRRFNLMPKNY